MKKLNLRRYYNHHVTDYFVEMSDEEYHNIVECNRKCHNIENAQAMKDSYWNLSYDLEIYQNYAILSEHSAEDEYLRIKEIEDLYAYLLKLPEQQARRIIAYYFFGLSETQIARIENVEQSVVHRSIEAGLKKLYKFFMLS